MYTGLILKESLENAEFLTDDRITITKEEKWNVGKRAADWQPKVWTAIYVKGADKDIEDVAKIVSTSILEKWYANLSDSTTEYVIFHKRIYSYARGDIGSKQEARNYGKLIGVPDHQLDW